MQLAVTYNKAGDLLMFFDPAKMHDANGTITYTPVNGEMHAVMDLPKGLESKPFTELHNLLRVNAGGAQPKLEMK
jgi:hypothetical protein